MKYIRKITLLAGLTLTSFSLYNCNAYDIMGQMYSKDTTATTTKQLKVFVSSSTAPGNMSFSVPATLLANCNLTGLSNANCACNYLASTAGLSGKYNAWLSVQNGTLPNDAACNIVGQTGTVSNHCNGASFSTDIAYADKNGNKLFNSWNDITTGSQHPQNSIMTTETGGNYNGNVWTGTYDGGTLAPGTPATTTCSDWAGGGGGIYGFSYNTTLWTNAVTVACGLTAYPIYCFEQP
jgi:hypothetical protein